VIKDIFPWLGGDGMYYRLSTVLLEDIKGSGRTQASIADEVGVSKPTLSQVLNGEKAISLQLLDGITSALEKPPGYYYELYVEECFSGDGKRPRKRKKLVKYVLHCLEQELETHAEKAIDRMLEEGGYLPNIFEIGEELYNKGCADRALKYYDLVVQNEKDRTALHLAMSYYRRMMIVRTVSVDLYEEAAIRLCEYLDFVSDDEMLEAYYRVICAFRLKGKWEHVLRYGERLIVLAEKANMQNYVGDALIKMAIAAREKGEYDLSLHYIDRYADIYPFESKLNRCITQITAGDTSKIKVLFDLCVSNKEGSFEVLEFLLGCLVKHDLYEMIERFFTEFAEQIGFLESITSQEPIYTRHYVNLKTAKALWMLKQGNPEGVSQAVTAAEMAENLCLTKQTLQCLKLVLEHAQKDSPEYKKGLMILGRIA
jgi:transcriptional regulator with XRE-family HTH domain